MSVVTGDNNNNNDDGDGGPRRSSCRRYCHAGDDDVWVDAVAGLRTRGVATGTYARELLLEREG